MSMPAARVTWQATVRWEGVAQVQQPSAAAVKARHTTTVHLSCKNDAESRHNTICSTFTLRNLSMHDLPRINGGVSDKYIPAACSRLPLWTGRTGTWDSV